MGKFSTLRWVCAPQYLPAGGPPWEITDSMKVAAARAIAGLIGEEPNPDYILPAPFDPRVAEAVAQAVAEEAVRLGLNRRQR